MLVVCDALVAAMGGPVFVLQFFAVVLLIVLAAVGYCKGCSNWSLIEMMLLIGGYGTRMLGFTQLHLSFPEFLITKLVASIVCFGIETLLMNSKTLALPPLTYLIGASQICGTLVSLWGQSTTTLRFHKNLHIPPLTLIRLGS